ncbi:MAG: ABC transporter ATP-binding protein [Erysipelotrichaceae bacterium]|nr:ABC transporter ATP-binding protein [Erysipelotrichaceae bacterium]
MTYITVKDLTLGYDNEAIVEHLSFNVEEKDYLCIVGENGSGKTTLMKTLLHLLPPLSGEILYSEGFQGMEIGYLPQQTEAQKDFPASVGEIVLSGNLARSKWHPFFSKEEKQRARDNMERVGVLALKDRCYKDLSGGQKQRVLLARALCATDQMLLLDEPMAALDPEATRNLYTLLKKLNDEGIAIIMITHDISEALPYAKHVLHIGNEIIYTTKENYLKGRAEA